MKSINAFFLSISILLLFGCNKGAGTFILEGVVTDASFNQPLAGAEVELYGINGGNNQYALVASAVTGADGKYSFTFDRTRTEKYTLYVKKPLYFEQELEVYFSQLKLNFERPPTAWTRESYRVQFRIAFPSVKYFVASTLKRLNPIG